MTKEDKKEVNEKRSKKKFKFKKFFIVILLLYIFGFFLYELVISPIKNIYVVNNKYLTDQEIIDDSGLRDYPSFILSSKHKIKKKLLNNKLISNVKIEKRLFGKVYITITENTPLFYYDNEVVLQDASRIKDNSFVLPQLTNYVDETIFNKLVEKYNEVDDEIRIMISEIKYVPNDIDKERFIFTMNDGNYVYITLYKTTAINDYIKILSNLEDNKGILYLDSGNYFEIFK